MNGLALHTPTSLLLWLSQQALPFALVFAVITFIVILLYVSARTRTAQMNEARSGSSESTFVTALLPFGFDEHIMRATYQYLQETQQVSFPIVESDLLDEDLGLSVADVELSVRDLLAVTGRLYRPGLNHGPLLTVEDLLRSIQASPRRSRVAA